jgi:predicted nucleic acid-binding Zn ribbon protein
MKKAKYLSYGNKRQPEEISEVLGSVIERASVNIDVRQGNLIERWSDVAPGDWAEVARPIGIRDHTLLVEVASGAGGSLLKYQIQQLLDAISLEFGTDLVTSVRFRVARS